MTDYQTERAWLLVGDAQDRLRDLPDDSIHTVVTSPPYWGLRDYGAEDQIGLEDTPEEYVANLVDVFRRVRRVLRPDGTLWLNLGDSYAATGKSGGGRQGEKWEQAGLQVEGPEGGAWSPAPDDLKQKDLVGIPWRVALALQDDGWWLRSDNVWAKGISGEERLGQCMPESVTDRPTKSHEYVFLLTPSKSYFYDYHAVREDNASPSQRRHNKRYAREYEAQIENAQNREPGNNNSKGIHDRPGPPGGNLRTVWRYDPASFEDAHFAVYPTGLIRNPVRAGTSEKGACAECGAPWERKIETTVAEEQGPVRRNALHPTQADAGQSTNGERSDTFGHYTSTTTTGWTPTCDCDTDDTVPCTVLDPFLGAGTTMLVALEEGRDALGVELNPEYAEMAWKRVRDLAEMPRLDQLEAIP